MWIKDLKLNSSPDIKLFLIGNKSDLENERIISKNDAEKIKEDYEMDYFIETSAKTGMNAQEIFIEAARLLYKDYSKYKNENKNKESNDDKNNNKLNLSQEKDKKKNKNCC